MTAKDLIRKHIENLEEIMKESEMDGLAILKLTFEEWDFRKIINNYCQTKALEFIANELKSPEESPEQIVLERRASNFLKSIERKQKE